MGPSIELYTPGTDQIALLGSLFLSVFYVSVIPIVFCRRNAFLMLAFIYILTIMILRDVLLSPIFCFYRWSFTDSRRRADLPTELGLSPWLFVFLCAPLGFLPLIKGSMLPLTGLFVALYSVFLWWNGLRAIAICTVVSPIVTAVLAWTIVGQSIEDLPMYALSMMPIISGYTDAMAISGDTTQIIGYVVVSIAIIGVLSSSHKLPLAPRTFLVLCFSGFLLVSLKAGFVRHDGHSLIAGSALIVAAVLLVCALPGSRIALAVVLAAGICTYSINYAIVPSAKGILFDPLINTYRAAYYGIKNRVESSHRLSDEYKAHLQAIRSELAIDTLPGTTDIYAYNQAYLLASNNVWRPRPTLQSYSAYTPALAEMDHEHLLRRPPDNIVFRVETIDGRIPSLDDGSSWPILLNSFIPQKFADDLLYLRRGEQVADADRTPVQKGVRRFNEIVRLPTTDHVLFAQLSFTKTFVGKLASFLLKVDPLDVEVGLADGTTRKFRVIPGMTETGFVLSPLIESTGDFAFLFGDRSELGDKAVRSIRYIPS